MRVAAGRSQLAGMKKWLLLSALLVLSPTAPAASQAAKDFAALLALKPDESRGRDLFAACTRCHGPTGSGETSGATPRIAGQHHRILLRQIVDFRKGRRWDFRMEGVAAAHDKIWQLQDVADVAWYVSRMTWAGSTGFGDGQFLELGSQLYSANCARCHGKNAEGDDARDMPRLAGQHAAYLARQIYDAVDGRRPPLGKSHGTLLAPLSFEQVRGLTDWLSRLEISPDSPPGAHGIPVARRIDGHP
jgi:cytochrome c553